MIQDYPYDSAVSDASLKTFVAFLAYLVLLAVLWLFLAFLSFGTEEYVKNREGDTILSYYVLMSHTWYQ